MFYYVLTFEEKIRISVDFCSAKDSRSGFKVSIRNNAVSRSCLQRFSKW